MRVQQLRATLEEFAALQKSRDKALALQALSRALRGADARGVEEIVPVLERAAAVAKLVDTVSSRQ